MYNTIKKINMEIVYENFCDFDKTKTEKEIENKCIEIEQSQEFKDLFFFCDIDSNNYFYELKDEKKIKDYLGQYFPQEFLTNDLFIEYGDELLDCECSGDSIELQSYIGKIAITEEIFYESLEEEFLKNEEIIGRLVKANNFYEEMEIVKKDCLKFLIQIMIDDIKDQIDNYKF